MVTGRDPRGRLFLPSNVAQVDENGNRWFTADVQYIADGPTPGSLVWDWHHRSGVYVPIQVIHGESTGGGENGGGEQPPVEGLTAAQVALMIEAAVRPLREELATAVKFDQGIALEADSGMVLCAEGGGPRVPERRFELTSRAGVASWETWKVRRGQGQ
jgi:hypothetical protein